MELIKRRRKHTLCKIYKPAQHSYPQSFINSNTASLSSSFVQAERELNSVLTDFNLQKKASFILKQLIRENTMEPQKQAAMKKKISLMSHPKKKFLKSHMLNIKMNMGGYRSCTTSRVQENSDSAIGKTDKISTQNSSQMYSQGQNIFPCKHSPPKLFLPLQGYFNLILTKIANSGKFGLVKILAEQLNSWYDKNSNDIVRDVLQIRKIGRILLRALGSKQNFMQLKPYEVMDINGTVPRLIFHFTHIISSRKNNKKANLVKIYHQIQYCARSVSFNKLTLQICFIIGNLLKEDHRSEEAKVYFDKALKLSIQLNDRFHEEKAIDLIGMSYFAQAKTSSAFFYHNNVEKLDPIERIMMKQKYSYREQVQKIGKVRDFQRCHSSQKRQGTTFGENKLQSYIFTGAEQEQNFEQKQKKQFKSKMSSYIRNPSMRSATLKAKLSLEKINQIGKVKRLKRFETMRANFVCKVRDEFQTSNEVLLTHRSLNRIKPEVELKEIENEKSSLIELLKYYTSDHLFSFPEMAEYLPKGEASLQMEK